VREERKGKLFGNYTIQGSKSEVDRKVSLGTISGRKKWRKAWNNSWIYVGEVNLFKSK
jgi:hypothetical protein